MRETKQSQKYLPLFDVACCLWYSSDNNRVILPASERGGGGTGGCVFSPATTDTISSCGGNESDRIFSLWLLSLIRSELGQRVLSCAYC